jgi:formylmethanofuran dehydrogenase subunit B
MARKRSPEQDYICQRCGCACDRYGTRHEGGGQGMKACNKTPNPILRSVHEAEVKAVAESVLNRFPWRREDR